MEFNCFISEITNEMFHTISASIELGRCWAIIRGGVDLVLGAGVGRGLGRGIVIDISIPGDIMRSISSCLLILLVSGSPESLSIPFNFGIVKLIRSLFIIEIVSSYSNFSPKNE